ncbi:MAG: hypothetical protein REI94_07915 [Moraxellaceae bacterium]|nr:hypothetical protein [Moraxellaceae bacterium]
MNLRRYVLIGLLASVLLHLALLDYWRGQAGYGVNTTPILSVPALSVDIRPVAQADEGKAAVTGAAKAPAGKAEVETKVETEVPPRSFLPAGRIAGPPAQAVTQTAVPPAIQSVAEGAVGFRPLNAAELPVSRRLALVAALIELAPDLLVGARERVAARVDEQGRLIALGRDGEWLEAAGWQGRLGALSLPAGAAGDIELELLPR